MTRRVLEADFTGNNSINELSYSVETAGAHDGVSRICRPAEIRGPCRYTERGEKL